MIKISKKIQIDLNKIKQDYLSGKTVTEIAIENDCSLTTIRSRLKEINDEVVNTLLKRVSKKQKHTLKCKVCNNYKRVCKTTQLCGKCMMENKLKLRIIDEYIPKDFIRIVECKKNTFYVYENFTDMLIYSKKHSGIIVVKISNEDVELVKNHSWNIHPSGYARSRINTKGVLLHRFIFKNCDQVDHRNGDTLNNTRTNLRGVIQSENQVNKKKMVNNTSGVTGVVWDKVRDKWKVRLSIYSKTYNLGRFDNFDDAVKVRKDAEIKYHKEFSPVNN